MPTGETHDERRTGRRGYRGATVSDAPATFLFADIAGFTVWRAARPFSPTRARCCREGANFVDRDFPPP